MSVMIQVRNVPDNIHRTLKTRAATTGMSLSDYIKRELVSAAEQASIEEVDERLRHAGRSKMQTKTVLAALREARER